MFIFTLDLFITKNFNADPHPDSRNQMYLFE